MFLLTPYLLTIPTASLLNLPGFSMREFPIAQFTQTETVQIIVHLDSCIVFKKNYRTIRQSL